MEHWKQKEITKQIWIIRSINILKMWNSCIFTVQCQKRLFIKWLKRGNNFRKIKFKIKIKANTLPEKYIEVKALIYLYIWNHIKNSITKKKKRRKKSIHYYDDYYYYDYYHYSNYKEKQNKWICMWTISRK